jgi:aspartate-semialdehyde dehydrogenase
MGYRVVVVGATGNVGREILNILAEREFPLDEVAAVASPRSTGDLIDFGDSGTELKIRNIEHFDFAGWDMALFAAGSAVSRNMRPAPPAPAAR